MRLRCSSWESRTRLRDVMGMGWDAMVWDELGCWDAVEIEWPGMWDGYWCRWMSPRMDGQCAVSSSSSTTDLNRWHLVRQNSENSHCRKRFFCALEVLFGLFSVFHHLADTFPKCAENSYTIMLMPWLGFHFGRTRRTKKKKTEKENLILIPEIQTQISSGCGWMVSGFGSLGLGQATVMKQLQTISQQPR